MDGGTPAEIASVGNEGMLGISVFMGEKALPKQAIVRTVGYGYRLKARLLLEEFNRSETLQDLLINYTKVLITQASQVVICNRYHSVNQKLCRWLLLNFDHISSHNSSMPHELLARSLGIHGDALTEPLTILQQRQIISYHCGQITTLNRSYLEDHACECYGMIKAKTDRFLIKSENSKPIPDAEKTWSKARNIGLPVALYGAS
ncbi:MAG: Crp/Fnr family transcriptional regulator [Nitrosomonadales bacterium]